MRKRKEIKAFAGRYVTLRPLTQIVQTGLCEAVGLMVVPHIVAKVAHIK